jgi:diguanylate cyclase (GGDEF)-like protein
VLRAVTGRLKAEVRSYDAVGRYGGEEFLILLPGCDRARLEAKAEQLRRTADRNPIETSAGPVPVTISIGGIASGECPQCEFKKLLRATDMALYRAKLAGRNRAELAGASDAEAAATSAGAPLTFAETLESSSGK